MLVINLRFCVRQVLFKGLGPWRTVHQLSDVPTKFSSSIVQYLKDSKLKYQNLGLKLQQLDISPAELKTVGKAYSSLGRLISIVDEREKFINQFIDLKTMEIEETSKVEPDKDLLMMIQAERDECLTSLTTCEERLTRQLVPQDEDDDRGVVVEVRAGTGGDEASLFAGEVYEMYRCFCELKRWKWEQLAYSKSEIGGFKEAQAIVSGDGVYQLLKYESGVHRVQRIPVNDTKIQTSAASVIVMPEAEELDVEICPQDLRIDVFRSQGAGGQSVNKTESAVRITHLPTGLSVSMQDERSQIMNRQRAMQYLRARLYDHERKKANTARSELRSLAHGTGDRSDKIRTYNFPQDRVTDHRIGLTVQGIERVMSGIALDGFLQQLVATDESQRLEMLFKSIESGNSSESQPNKIKR